MKIFAKVGPSGRPIPKPSIYLYNLLLNTKKELVTASSKSYLNSYLVRPITVSYGELNNYEIIMLIVSCKGTFVNKLSISKEAIIRLSEHDRLHTSSQKLYEFLTLY